MKKLQDEYDSARAREQSLENRILGAATMAATGVGGMQLASGLAEQKADEMAELDMNAYIATFMCDYGMGRNVRGGQMNIDLPNSAKLMTLKSEYMKLAADLKVRKEALGLAPGIESEIVLNSGSSGLYDNVSAGKTDGAFTSLYRALTDENSVDATEWQEQKDQTTEKIKTGATIGGTGATGGTVGNLIINRDTNKTDK